MLGRMAIDDVSTTVFCVAQVAGVVVGASLTGDVCCEVAVLAGIAMAAAFTNSFLSDELNGRIFEEVMDVVASALADSTPPNRTPATILTGDV